MIDLDAIVIKDHLKQKLLTMYLELSDDIPQDIFDAQAKKAVEMLLNDLRVDTKITGCNECGSRLVPAMGATQDGDLYDGYKCPNCT